MGGGASRPAFFEALFKKRQAALPIDFGFFLLDWSEQGRKAQQRRSGAEPVERSKATLETPRALAWHSKMGRLDAGRFCPGRWGVPGRDSASLAGPARGERRRAAPRAGGRRRRRHEAVRSSEEPQTTTQRGPG